MAIGSSTSSYKTRTMLTMVVITAMTVALVEAAGNRVGFWVPVVLVMVAGAAIAEHRWLINRAGVVIDRSRQHLNDLG